MAHGRRVEGTWSVLPRVVETGRSRLVRNNGGARSLEVLIVVLEEAPAGALPDRGLTGDRALEQPRGAGLAEGEVVLPLRPQGDGRANRGLDPFAGQRRDAQP